MPVKFLDEEPVKEISKARVKFLDEPIKKPTDPFLPNAEKVEGLISKRDDMLSQFMNEMQTQKKPGIESLLNPVEAGKAALTGGRQVLTGIGGVFQRGEAALANAGLELQRGETDVLGEIQKGLSGEKLGELGDIIRTTGVGGRANEALSVTTGFFGALGAGNFATAGMLKAGATKIQKALDARKAANLENQKFFFKRRADMLSEGADDVINGIRSEFDDLYNKIGDNPLGPDDQAFVGEILKTIPPATLKRLARVQGVDLTKGELPSNLNTVKSIKGILGRAIPRKVWSGVEDANELQAKMIDDYHELNDVLAKNSGEFKETLMGLNKKFKKALDYRKVINKITKESGTGVTKTTIRGIKEPSQQGNLAVLENFSKEFFPQTTQILTDIDKYNRMIKTTEAFKHVGKRIVESVAVGGAVGVGFSAVRGDGY